MRYHGIIWLCGYVATIIGANWLIEHYGVVPVGFGLTAPAGVFAAGLAFTFRDLTHEAFGWRGALVAIAAGAGLSWYISDGVTLPGGVVSLAAASGLAFLVSELADLGVYSPLRQRTWLGAVGLSNTVGLVVDSALFLALAFGSVEFLAGQVWAKLVVTVITVAVLGAFRVRMRKMVELEPTT